MYGLFPCIPCLRRDLEAELERRTAELAALAALRSQEMAALSDR